MSLLKTTLSTTARRIISQLTCDIEGEFSGLFPYYLRPFLEQGAVELEHYAQCAGFVLNEDIEFNALRLLAQRHKNLAIRSLITHFQYLRDSSGWEYESYNGDIADGWARKDLFAQVPLLKSLTATCQKHWSDYVVKVVKCIEEDAAGLHHNFGIGGTIRSIEFGLGDPHRGGLSIAVCQWESGEKVVLKLISASPAGFVEDVLRLLDPNREFFGPVLPKQWVPPEGNRQWQRFVERSTLTVAEVSRYFRRFGRCSVLLLALGGNDFHRENVICTHQGPVFIDTETLTSLPTIARDPSDNLFEKIAEEESYSVLRTLLYPVQFAGSPVSEELSAIGVPVDSARVVEGITICDQGTNSIRFGQSPIPIQATKNTVIDESNNQVDPRAYIHEIIEGVREALCHLKQHEDILSQVLDKGFSFGFRHVPRPTWIYAKLLEASTHPSRLEDPSARSHTLSLLPDVDPRRMGADLSAAMRQEEIASLSQLDIPYFWVAADGTVTGRSATNPLGKLSTTPSGYVQQWWTKVISISPEEQVRRIQLSLSAVGNNPYEKADIIFRRDRVDVPAPLPDPVVAGQGKNKRSTWLTTHQIQGKVQLNLLSPAFYEGGGVLVSFFSDRRHGLDPHTKADLVMEALRGAIPHDLPQSPNEIEYLTYSAFGGIPGELVTELDLAAAGVEGDFRYPQIMNTLVGQLPELIDKFTAQDAQDFLNGLSGTFTAINQFREELNRHRVFESWNLDADFIHNRLDAVLTGLENDSAQPLGLAHGRSGQLLGLFELMDVLTWQGVRVPRQQVQRAQQLLAALPEKLDDDASMIDPVAAHSWCKGRAGFLPALRRMARLVSDWKDGETQTERITTVKWADQWVEHSAKFLLQTARDLCQTGDISFCHGVAGGLLNWKNLADLTGSDVVRQLTDTYYSEFLKVSATSGWRGGLYSSPYAEGFFVGRSGWDLATAHYEGQAVYIPRLISLDGGKEKS